MKTFPLVFNRIEKFMFAISWTDPLYAKHENWSKIVVNKSEKPFHFSGSFVWFMYSKGFICFGFTRKNRRIGKIHLLYGFFTLPLSRSLCMLLSLLFNIIVCELYYISQLQFIICSILIWYMADGVGFQWILT